MAAREERRSFWTWGYVSDEPTEAQRKQAAGQASARLGREVRVAPVPRIDDIALPPSRIDVPSRLSGFVRADKTERLTTPTADTARNCWRPFAECSGTRPTQ